ncbi:MAG: hypothetical protein KA022_02210 [Candidatus Omnitrophica bacterium]|nr:hypothetical protein [Candidatus Omnitrophota bacterium]
MSNLEVIKKRFLKDDLAKRLGGIASNLARLKSFSQLPNNKKAIGDLIEESKFFIEWTAPEAPLNIRQELIDIQLKLALYQHAEDKKEMAKSADEWAQKLLKFSGLLAF